MPLCWHTELSGLNPSEIQSRSAARVAVRVMLRAFAPKDMGHEPAARPMSLQPWRGDDHADRPKTIPRGNAMADPTIRPISSRATGHSARPTSIAQSSVRCGYLAEIDSKHNSGTPSTVLGAVVSAQDSRSFVGLPPHASLPCRPPDCPCSQLGRASSISSLISPRLQQEMPEAHETVDPKPMRLASRCSETSACWLRRDHALSGVRSSGG